MYNFTAPLTPGTYTTTIVDQEGNWNDHFVSLKVTNSPTPDTTYSVQITVGEDTTFYFYQTWELWKDFIPDRRYYIPSQTQKIKYTTNPSVPWLTIQPSNFTLSSMRIQRFLLDWKIISSPSPIQRC